METLLIQANAKINLDLRILRKLPNGYHQIKSTFQSIDLADFLLFEKSKKDNLTGAIIYPSEAKAKRTAFSSSPSLLLRKSSVGKEERKFFDCPESQNIIFRAKNLLEKTINKKLPCRIHLHKAIPIAAGLGGGSADAAATIVALNEIYNLNLPRKELVKIGVEVGADIPFFFYGGTCKIGGIGEKVSKIEKTISNFFVLFRPHKRLETKEMYRLYDKTRKTFFELAKEICPEIKKLERYLQKFPIKEFNLSGSGPTVFAGVNDYELAQKITEGYQDFNGDIFICHPQNKALDIIEL